MNETRGSQPTHSSLRALLLVAISLCFLLVATSMPTLAEYDPGRPSSSTGKGGSSPDGGDPGGGDPGGGDPGGGDPGGGDPGGGDPGGGTGRTVALGVATPEAGIQELDAFTDAVGKKPAIWVLWSQWGGENTRQFPTTAANQLRNRDIQPMIWWEPVKPSDVNDPTYPRHKNITAGDHDAYIRQWARDAKAFGGTVLLRFAHESNNNYFPWSVNEFDNSNTTFINAWRHVVDIFRDEGANNVKWVWSVAKKSCPGGCNPYTEVYPGNNYVDIMAFSGYNWGTHNGKSWMSMFDSYDRATRKLREISNKPIMVAETASNSIGGDKPAWIRDGYREVFNKLPDIEAIVYLNADLRDVGHPNWSLTSPAGALAAYAEIANLAKFTTRSPFGARVTVKAKTGGDKAKRKRAVKKTTPNKEPVAKKEPKVRKGAVVDPKTKDSKVDSATNKVTKRPKNKQKSKNKKPEPVQVLDTFSR